MVKIRPQLKSRNIIIEIDHNPYSINFYNSKNDLKDVIIFPIFHFEGERQYYDLLAPIINRGDQVITINLLTKNDRVLYCTYYFQILEKIIQELFSSKILKKNQRLVLMGFGVGAYILTKLPKNHDLNIERMILISPVNSYKGDFEFSDVISELEIPTFIHYGQNDEVVSLDTRYKLFEKGHNNPNVHFSSYPVCGHYLYYKDILSLRLERYYKKTHYNRYIGEKSKYKVSPLPEDSIVNERFFEHLFNEIDGIPNKKKIVLMTDVAPLFVNGVAVVMDLLQLELQKLGYEVYIGALWHKKKSYKNLPNDTYIPIKASYATFLKGYKELQMLMTLKFQKNAKMLALFGFDYIHLHTEYSMGVISKRLSKLTGVKIVYTHHTMWNLYYENKFGKYFGRLIYKIAVALVFKHVYKDCDIITVPSKKSYENLKKDIKKKEAYIIPAPVNKDKFELSKDDKAVIERLRVNYNLKGKKVLGYVGRVSLEKNIVETLRHIAKIKHDIPNIVFLIVGIGDAVLMLKKAVKRLKLEENVIFVGEIENSKLKYYYSLFDAFVTASTFETQGITYFEAATCGTPILAKADDAISGVFIDGENAYIYHSYAEWARRLEKILFSNNKDIINNAKKTMMNYSSESWAKRLLALYKKNNPEKKS